MDNIHKSSTKVLIVTSTNADDDDDGESLLNLIHSTTINKIKRSINDEVHNPWSKIENTKRRKADLTCVICEGSAFGHHFGQITCESCKAFFRRNALQEIAKTRCSKSNGIRCIIRYDVQQKCQRCRLLKCLEFGMRKDLILTPEEKLNRQNRLEENRRLRSIEIKTELLDIKTEYVSNDDRLTNEDWAFLDFIQNAYLTASQSIPTAASILSLELESDKMSTYMNTLNLHNFGAVIVINFLKQIREFEELNEHDRLILVKYNLNLAGLIRFVLTFDATREIWYVDPIDDSISKSDEAFAEQCKSIHILCYGYDLFRTLLDILNTIENLVNKDPIIIHLLMLTMIFLKGLSADDDQEPILMESQRVFQAHSKYADLLFRYLIEQSSFDIAVIKMMRIVGVLMKIQGLTRDFQQQVKSKIDVNYINPLMKSLLHMT
ncbi:hypothetical protein I4U23_006210 [Adineta vaga]|nr:hypothetical protein I4U23_006210 [Adineta vaga]